MSQRESSCFSCADLPIRILGPPLTASLVELVNSSKPFVYSEEENLALQQGLICYNIGVVGRRNGPELCALL